MMMHPAEPALRLVQVFVAEGNGEEWKLDGIVWQSKAT